jgi:hypothetical protein
MPQMLKQINLIHAEGLLTDQHVLILAVSLADRGDVASARRLMREHMALRGLLSPSPSIAIPLLAHVLTSRSETIVQEEWEPSSDPRAGEIPPLPGYLQQGLILWRRDLLAYEQPLSLQAYSLLISSLLEHSALGFANSALDDALDKGKGLRWLLAAPFIEHFVGLGEPDKAMRLYNGVRGQNENEPVPGRVWEALIDGQLRAGNLRIAKELFAEAKSNGLSQGAIKRFKAGAGL